MISKKFTLVELLVIVSVLTILLTLLQSTLSHALDGARNVVCINNLKHQGVAASLYNSDHQDWMVPTGVSPKTGKVSLYSRDSRYGGVLNYYYLNSYEHFVCPSREKDVLHEKYQKPWFVRDTDHPFESSVAYYGAAYLRNWGHKFRSISYYTKLSDGRAFVMPLLLQQIDRPSERLLFADSLGSQLVHGIESHNPYINPDAPGWGASASLAPRHLGHNTNYVTVDGHVKSVFYKDVYVDYNNPNSSLWCGNTPVNYPDNIFQNNTELYIDQGVIIEVQ